GSPLTVGSKIPTLSPRPSNPTPSETINEPVQRKLRPRPGSTSSTTLPTSKPGFSGVLPTITSVPRVTQRRKKPTESATSPNTLPEPLTPDASLGLQLTETYSLPQFSTLNPSAYSSSSVLGELSSPDISSNLPLNHRTVGEPSSPVVHESRPHAMSRTAGLYRGYLDPGGRNLSTSQQIQLLHAEGFNKLFVRDRGISNSQPERLRFSLTLERATILVSAIHELQALLRALNEEFVEKYYEASKGGEYLNSPQSTESGFYDTDYMQASPETSLRKQLSHPRNPYQLRHDPLSLKFSLDKLVPTDKSLLDAFEDRTPEDRPLIITYNSLTGEREETSVTSFSAGSNWKPSNSPVVAVEEGDRSKGKAKAIAFGDQNPTITIQPPSLSNTVSSQRLAAWGAVFSAYAPGLEIIHRPGRIHSNVDPLSRIPRSASLHDSPLPIEGAKALVLRNPDRPMLEPTPENPFAGERSKKAFVVYTIANWVEPMEGDANCFAVTRRQARDQRTETAKQTSETVSVDKKMADWGNAKQILDLAQNSPSVVPEEISTEQNPYIINSEKDMLDRQREWELENPPPTILVTVDPTLLREYLEGYRKDPVFKGKWMETSVDGSSWYPGQRFYKDNQLLYF
ncbi:hypothetical protein BJ138DRAFT_1120460, partial [Hygrophoropsis aurantiaca]